MYNIYSDIFTSADETSAGGAIEPLLDGSHSKPKDNKPKPLTNVQMFWALTKFMIPLVVTQMVPDIAEQVGAHRSSNSGRATYFPRFIFPNTVSD